MTTRSAPCASRSNGRKACRGARNLLPPAFDRQVWSRILVVEDEPKMATLVRRGLERESFACDLAVDGNEALWATREVTYDAIVLDVMIPAPTASRCAAGCGRRATGRRCCC